MDTKKNRRLTITLSDEEDKYITTQAQRCGLSKASFIREATLSGQVVNSLPEAKLRGMIARLYTLAEQIEDTSIRKQLKEGADDIWQSSR